MVGSVWGFLLAGAVSLIAVMGEIATIALLAWQVSGSDAERIVLIILLSVGSVLVAAYSIRALVLLGALSARAEGKPVPRSLLGTTRNSATL
jgi:hypothetical protein